MIIVLNIYDPLLIVLLQINLRLILVSGKTKEFLFSPSDSAGEIAKTVFEQWPEGEYSKRLARANLLIVQSNFILFYLFYRNNL